MLIILLFVFCILFEVASGGIFGLLTGGEDVDDVVNDDDINDVEEDRGISFLEKNLSNFLSPGTIVKFNDLNKLRKEETDASDVRSIVEISTVGKFPA